jgi:pyridoxal phosphate enzyme (YggS family)
MSNRHCTAAAMDVLTILRRNVDRVEARIVDACVRAGRGRAEVTLVAVTKYADSVTTALLASCGVGVMGESRPQTLWEKAAHLPSVEWHLVGHLQRNKVARTLPLAKLIHSVDSERLVRAIDDEAAKLGKVQDVLIELHLTLEEKKQGFSDADWPRLPETIRGLRHVRVTGLMCMAALDSTRDEARQTFARLRSLRDQWRAHFPPPHQLSHLSIGMTHDFEEAIAEGATLVRVGSALFDGLPSES